jgi:ribonuclease D
MLLAWRSIRAAPKISANRERLLNQEIVQAFFRQVRDYAELRAVLSHEHFSVDGTLIDAWALRKSLAPIDEETGPHQGQGKNPTVDFTGEKRSNATHRSTTDPDARLFRKSAGDKCTSVTQSEAYRTSLKVRKRIEEIFGWVKTVGGLRKARFVGLAKVKVQALIAFAAYNLVRLAKLSGWPLKAT